MIKGCAKRVIVVKNTNSEMFDEAYFIVNPNKGERKQSDFLAEVNKIISSEFETASHHRKSKKWQGILLSLSLLLVGAFAGFFISYFLSI